MEYLQKLEFTTASANWLLKMSNISEMLHLKRTILPISPIGLYFIHISNCKIILLRFVIVEVNFYCNYTLQNYDD